MGARESWHRLRRDFEQGVNEARATRAQHEAHTNARGRRDETGSSLDERIARLLANRPTSVERPAPAWEPPPDYQERVDDLLRQIARDDAARRPASQADLARLERRITELLRRFER